MPPATPVRTLRQNLATPGVNQVVWNLQYDATPPGQEPPAAARWRRVEVAAVASAVAVVVPAVVPGTYSVTLAAAGQEITKRLVVQLDPRAEVSMADLIAQRDAAFQLRELQGRVGQIVSQTESLVRQLTTVGGTLRQLAPTEREAITEARAGAGGTQRPQGHRPDPAAAGAGLPPVPAPARGGGIVDRADQPIAQPAHRRPTGPLRGTDPGDRCAPRPSSARS